MVAAVVGRCHKHPVGPAQLGHQLGVRPELVQRADQGNGDKHAHRNTGDGHGQVKNPVKNLVGGRLAQGGAQVVVFAGMVHHVRGPQQADLMAAAVRPVVKKVVHEERQHPDPRALDVPLKGRHFVQHHGIHHHGEQLDQHADGLADEADVQAGDGVVKAVDLALLQH